MRRFAALGLVVVAAPMLLAACPKIGNQEGVCGAGQTCECDGVGNCSYSCPGGHCDFRCKGIGNCILSCEGGSCAADCQGTGNCTLSCPDQSCSMSCKVTGNCVLTPCTKGCPKEAGPDKNKADLSAPRREAGRDGVRDDGLTAKDGVIATPCGPKICTQALELCMVKYPVAQSTSFSCETVPKGCEGASLHTCACAGAALCSAPYDSCTDGPSSNTITCTCQSCH
jgi:hypothetical protein